MRFAHEESGNEPCGEEGGGRGNFRDQARELIWQCLQDYLQGLAQERIASGTT